MQILLSFNFKFSKQYSLNFYEIINNFFIANNEKQLNKIFIINILHFRLFYVYFSPVPKFRHRIYV